MPPRPPRSLAARGFALIMVLLVTSVAIVVVVELFFQSNCELLAARNVTDIAQIEYAIDGQLEVVLGTLRFDKRQNDATDSTFDEWNAQSLRERRDGDVGLETRVYDEGGKFNLARLVTGDDAKKARAKEILVRILDLFREGISEEKTRGGDLDQADAEDLAERIIGHMKRPGAIGQVPKPRTTPADVPMLLDELLFVDTKDNHLLRTLLYDLQTKEKVAPGLHRYLTVFGTAPYKVNLNTAPLVVLKAEFPNVQDRDFAQKIVDRRNSAADDTAGGTGSSAMGTSGMSSSSGSSTDEASASGNPFSDVNGLTDGSVEGLTAEVLQRNGIDPGVEFDVKSDVFGIRIQGATERTQRDELYVVERVRTDGFRFLLHQERTDRLLATDEDAAAGSTSSK